MNWLEPISYTKNDDGWWASARHVTVRASSKEKARAKLYRAVSRLYVLKASETFGRLGTTDAS